MDVPSVRAQFCKRVRSPGIHRQPLQPRLPDDNPISLFDVLARQVTQLAKLIPWDRFLGSLNIYKFGSASRKYDSRFSTSGFFHESVSHCPPGPQVFHWSLFEFFQKFAEIFANQWLSPVPPGEKTKSRKSHVRLPLITLGLKLSE